MKKNKVGILYICTGKYDVFWEEFYKSCEKYFLPNSEKYYFVFTDSNHLYDEENNKNIKKYYQENLGWPDNTLKRFHMFLTQEKEIEKMDYIFFLNANCEFKERITEEEFLPEKENLLFVQHPGYWDKKNDKFPYDRNELCTAYIPKGEGNVYICGGVNGGKTKYFIKLMKELKRRIDIDYSNNIIALWHDESQINRYLYEQKKYKLLSPSYCYQEGCTYKGTPKIIVRDKSKYIDVGNIKNKNLFQKIKDKLYSIYISIKGGRK